MRFLKSLLIISGLTAALLAHGTQFPAAFHPAAKVNRIRIGIASRCYAAIEGNHIYYSEKNRPPRPLAPGAVYRRFFKIALNSTRSVRLADLGNVKANPILVPELNKMFYTRRINDSNQDGLLGFDDNRIICVLDLDGISQCPDALAARDNQIPFAYALRNTTDRGGSNFVGQHWFAELGGYLCRDRCASMAIRVWFDTTRFWQYRRCLLSRLGRGVALKPPIADIGQLGAERMATRECAAVGDAHKTIRTGASSKGSRGSHVSD